MTSSKREYGQNRALCIKTARQSQLDKHNWATLQSSAIPKWAEIKHVRTKVNRPGCLRQSFVINVKLVSHSCPTVVSKLLRKQVRTKMSRPEMSSPMTSAVRDSWEECPDLLSSSQFLLLTFICILNSTKGDRAHEKKWIKAPLCRWERLDM